jgi:hypothetical protein
MMKRLFTFGCSFTNYIWPTYADQLAQDYDHYENWGILGTGNRAIVERLAECHSLRRFAPGDTVIVQWSSHLRHDYWNPNSPYHRFHYNWKTCGNIMSQANREIFTGDWARKFFHETGYVLHSLNAMVLALNLLENTGCTWRWTSIGSWPLLGRDLITEDQPRGSDQNLTATSSPGFDIYQYIFSRPEWLAPIAPIIGLHPDLSWQFRDEPFPHPSPRQHGVWLESVGLKPTKPYPHFDRLDQLYSQHRLIRGSPLMAIKELIKTAGIPGVPNEIIGL